MVFVFKNKIKHKFETQNKEAEEQWNKKLKTKQKELKDSEITSELTIGAR